MKSLRLPVPPERELQNHADDTALLFRWAILGHARSDLAQLAPTAKGGPDRIYVRDRILFVEFKRPRGKRSDDQVGWGDLLTEVASRSNGLIAYHLWRPEDWDNGEIERTLR